MVKCETTHVSPTAEQLLITRARTFEKGALTEIFDRYHFGIYSYALRLLGDSELARECMSATFERFLNGLNRGIGPDAYLQAYLYRIAHNWITDYYRKKASADIPLAAGLVTDADHDPAQVVANRMELQKIRAAMAKLTPEQRQVISLKYLENWENEEIARAMNKPVGAIKSLQHRAINTLRRLIR